MFKKFKIVFIIVIFLAICGAVAFYFSFNSIVKKSVETFTPKITQTTAQIDNVKISPFSGSGEIRGLVIGNPEGFNTPYAFKLSQVLIDLEPLSVFSECVVINKILIIGPEVTYEARLGGSNIAKIQQNIESFVGPTSDSGEDRESPSDENKGKEIKIQLGEFLFQDGNINLSTTMLEGTSIPIPLPEIRLSEIGTDTDGASVNEISKEVFIAISEAILDSVQDSGQLKGIVSDATKKLQESALEASGKIMKGMENLFNKKK